MTTVALGSRCRVQAGAGTVRFVGQTSFATGKWVGVELDVPNGKNDGSVQGVRYFDCEALHGVFVRPVQVKADFGEGDGDESSRVASPALTKPPSRPASTAGSVGSPRLPSTPGVVSPRLGATARRPVSALLSGASSSGASSPAPSSRVASPGMGRTPTAPRVGGVAASALAARRPSAQSATTSAPMTPSRSLSPSKVAVPSPSTVRRPSATAPPAGARTLPQPQSRPASAASSIMMRQRTLSNSSSASYHPPRPVSMQRVLSDASSESLFSEELAVPEEDLDDVTEPLAVAAEEKAPTRHDPFSLVQAAADKPLGEKSVSKREYDELAAKMRILEARRSEDRETLREAERLRQEADDWMRVREKTKGKMSDMSSELKDLKKQVKDLSAERDTLEEKIEELTDQTELSMLDKEMAEEKLEEAEMSLATTKDRLAELDIEVNLLREQAARIESGEALQGDIGDTARASIERMQLEKQNDRLKDALLQLRDVSTHNESESRHKISDLEKELELTTDLQEHLDHTLDQLERAESQVEDLKGQLDDALGAEELLEQLTERNLSLNERLEEMKAIVEDLEALKELSDELEENHVETEAQLQEEIDLKDMVLRESQTRNAILEESVADYEGTITQFRELVVILQTDLEQLKDHQLSQQTETQSLSSQSQAMLNLNLKLQSSVTKGQVKTIELELRKVEARQHSQNLAITKPYLLPSYFDADSDAVDALLFFDRVAAKTEIINLVLEQAHSISDTLSSTVPEALVAVCETRVKLARFAAVCRRFAGTLRRCEPELFLKIGRVYLELASVEKRIDVFIDQLRREELREVECGQEVERLTAQAEHLASIHLSESNLDLAEREHSCITILDLELDTIAVAAGFAKQAVALVEKDADISVKSDQVELDSVVYEPLQKLVNISRNAKTVSKKLLRRIEELLAGSQAISMNHAQGIDTLAFNASAISSAIVKLMQEIAKYCQEVRTSRSTFDIAAVARIIQQVAAAELGLGEAHTPWEHTTGLLQQLSKDMATTMTAASDAEQVVKLDFPGPWVARVAELHAHAAQNAETERQVSRLNEEIRDLMREMRTKEQNHQENLVKIEVMEKRMESVKRQADAITELEGELAKTKKQEKAYEDAIEALQGDLDTMEQENAKLKQSASTATDTKGREGEAISYEGNMETSRLIEVIEGLRGAVRFLRSENSFLKSHDLLKTLGELPDVLATPDSALRPALRTAEATSLAVETQRLVKEALLLSATPRLVDISHVRGNGQRTGWQPRARQPAIQLEAERERALALSRKVQRLRERRNAWATAGPATISV